MFGLLVRYVVAYTVERRELQFAGILRACSHFIWHHTAYIGRITGDVLQVVYYGNPMLSAGLLKVLIFPNAGWVVMGGIRAHLLRDLAQDSFQCWTGKSKSWPYLRSSRMRSSLALVFR